MSDYNLQFLTSGVGVLSGPGGRVGFSNYRDFKLVKRYLYGKLDSSDNVTNGETETFIEYELDIIQSYLDKVREKTTIFRAWGTADGPDRGQVWLAGPGVWWHIPSPAYRDLLVARGLINRQFDSVPQGEIQLYRSLYLSSESNDSAVLDAVTKLSQREVEDALKTIRAKDMPEETVDVPEGITPSGS